MSYPKDWVNSIEQSHYYHYGTDKPQSGSSSTDRSSSGTSCNQQTRLEARARIRMAVADLLEKERLPMGITERFDALVTYGISGQTLYRHRDLWHPRHLQNDAIGDLQSDAGQESSWAASCPDNHPNLLVGNGCNSLSGGSFSYLEREEQSSIGCNSLPIGDLNHFETRSMTQEEGIAYIKQVLSHIKEQQQAKKLRRGRTGLMNYQISQGDG